MILLLRYRLALRFFPLKWINIKDRGIVIKKFNGMQTTRDGRQDKHRWGLGTKALLESPIWDTSQYFFLHLTCRFADWKMIDWLSVHILDVCCIFFLYPLLDLIIYWWNVISFMNRVRQGLFTLLNCFLYTEMALSSLARTQLSVVFHPTYRSCAHDLCQGIKWHWRMFHEFVKNM